MAMSMKEINEKLTDKFVKFLEDGLVNEQWVKPWNFANALPKRYDPKEKTWVTYSGTNFYFLALESLCMGYEFEEWGTFKQWKALGRVVRKGECGTEAFLPITVKKKMRTAKKNQYLSAFEFIESSTMRKRKRLKIMVTKPLRKKRLQDLRESKKLMSSSLL